MGEVLDFLAISKRIAKRGRIGSALARFAATANCAVAFGSIAISGAHAGEIDQNWAINYVKAPTAWERGYTGAGVTVAVMDTGVANISEFNGRLMKMWDAYKRKLVNPADDNGHGTFVAGLIGAALNNSGVVGVAYDARILPVKILKANGYLLLSDGNLARAYDVARQYGAKVSNNSWNSSTTATDLVNSYGYAGAKNYITANFGQTVAALQRFVDNGGVLVFAAGNDGKADPGYWASLPYFQAGLKPGFLAAVAIDSSGVIASWSDRCGLSAAYCLAAPGVNVISTSRTGGLSQGSGTSFAAPVISGAVAIIMDMWPYLSGGDVTGILLTSATKSGIYANTAIYGQGLLNLDAATKPIGTLSLAGSTTSTGLGTTQISSVFAAPSGATNAVVVDSYKRDYFLPTSALLLRQRDSFDLPNALTRFGSGSVYQDTLDIGGKSFRVSSFIGGGEAPWQQDRRRAVSLKSDDGWASHFGLSVDAATAIGLSSNGADWSRLTLADRSLNHGHVGLIQNSIGGALTVPFGSTSLSVGFATGQPGKDSIQSAFWPDATQAGDKRGQNLLSFSAAFQPLANVRLTSNAGYLQESESILGNRQSGVYSFGSSSRTMFFGIGGEIGLAPGLTFFGGYEIGWTDVAGASGSLVGNVSSIQSNSWRLGVRGENLFDQGDRLILAFSQPLAASKGRLTTVTPVAYDGFSGTVSYKTTTSSLAVTHRESNLQAAYSAMIAPDVQLSVGGLLRINPDNEKGPAEAIGMARLGVQF